MVQEVPLIGRRGHAWPGASAADEVLSPDGRCTIHASLPAQPRHGKAQRTPPADVGAEPLHMQLLEQLLFMLTFCRHSPARSRLLTALCRLASRSAFHWHAQSLSAWALHPDPSHYHIVLPLPLACSEELQMRPNTFASCRHHCTVVFQPWTCSGKGLTGVLFGAASACILIQGSKRRAGR